MAPREYSNDCLADAIASYAVARDVQAARVVFCDAAADDNGWMQPLGIAGRVQVGHAGSTRS